MTFNPENPKPTRYVQGSRWEVPFFRITSFEFLFDTTPWWKKAWLYLLWIVRVRKEKPRFYSRDDLLQNDVRKIIENQSVRDMYRAEDFEFTNHIKYAPAWDFGFPNSFKFAPARDCAGCHNRPEHCTCKTGDPHEDPETPDPE